MLRPFFLLLVALALLVSPMVMLGGEGVAAAHAAMPQAVEMQGHCPGDSGGPGGAAPDKDISCVSACAAVPASESGLVEPARPANGRFALAVHQVFVGVQPEGETPPPRIGPEI